MLDKFLSSRIKDAKKLVESLSKDYEYVSILGSLTRNKNIVVSNRQNSNNAKESECGFVIRVYKDGRYSEYSTNEIKGLSPRVIKKAINLKKIISEDKAIKLLNEEEHVEDYIREDKDSLSDSYIIKELKGINKTINSLDSRVIDARIIYMKRETNKIFVSNKKCLSQKYDWINCMTIIVVKEDDNVKDYYSAIGEADSLTALNRIKDETKDNLDIAIKMLKSKPIVPGTYEVITNPGVSGLIAHEAFGHGVELDMFVKNRAKAKDYINKKVASELVNMYDGAKGVISAASYFFDDDGIEAHQTQIIKDGILLSGISDSLSAMQLDKEPTGNGRRESFERKAYSRMTNTYFGPGNDDVDKMIESIKYGYLLCSANNGMEDPKNWQIQCTASYGLEIKDGKLTGEIVAPVVISGSVLDLLNSITMVSKEVEIHGSGSCGKGHKEWVRVSDGGPYLKAEAKLG